MSAAEADGGALLRARLARGPVTPEDPSTGAPAPGRTIPARTGLSAPLTGTQEALWFEARTTPGDPRHHRPTVIAWRGPVDVEALRAALVELVARHPTLTTTYPLVGQRPRQRPPDWWGGPAGWDLSASVDLVVVDARHDPRRLDAAVAGAAAWLVDLDQLRPLAATLVSRADDDHLLVLALTHLAIDGPSADLLVADLAAIYRRASGLDRPDQGARSGRGRALFADWVAWRDAQASVESRRDHLAWWSLMLAERRAHGADAWTLPRPTDPVGPAGPPGDGWRRADDGVELPWVVVPDEVADGLASLARVESVTLHGAALGAFAALWWQQRGIDDLVVAVPVSDRDLPELDAVVGCFVRVLPIRLRAGAHDTGRDLVRRAAAVTHAVLDHRQVTLADITAAVAVRERSGAIVDLADAHFQYRRVAPGPFRVGPASLELVTVRAQGHGPDVLVLDDGHRLRVAASVTGGSADDGQALARALVDQLTELVRSPDRGLRPTSGSAPAPIRATTPARPGPVEATLVDLFTRAEAAHPGRPALRDARGSVTYAELGRRARDLAAALAAAGVVAGDPVVLELDRSIDWVVAMLGVVLAGAVYVPLDPRTPDERASAMRADVAPAATVGPNGIEAHARAAGPGPADLDERVPGWSGSGPEAPVYVLFTSGSTGRPKGVVVTHANVVQLVLDPGYLPMTPDDVVVFSSNPVFDGTTIEVWGALAAGACLAIFEPEVLVDPVRLEADLRAWGATVLGLTSAVFNAVARYRPGAFATLRVVLFGGEAGEPRWVRAVIEAGGPQRLVHDYGPTETTCVVAYHDVLAAPPLTSAIPIGRPVAGATFQVRDDRGRPLPVGVPGELWIGGAGVALGYLRRPELTAERFVADRRSPGAGPGPRLYRSGDLVVRAPDGEITFLGRIDTQVKIRGYRIELGEIEAALMTHPAVDLAAVVARPASAGGESQLVAYVVAGDATRHLADDLVRELTGHLRRLLPPYMLPARILVVDRLAVGTTGKIDRRALPAPTDLEDPTRLGVAERRASGPDDGLATMVDLWRAALETTAVGPDDHFFDIGGHSLRALALLAAVADEFRVDLRVADLVEADTPRELTGLVRRRDRVASPDGVIELSPGAPVDPVWFIPAGVAIHFVRDYRALAHHLDLWRPARTLDPPGMRPGTAPRSSVPGLVRWYLARLDEQQPTGPLRLVGHSMAGVLALEIARAAQASGRQVPAVVLIDPRLPRDPLSTGHRARLVAGAARRRLRGEWAERAPAAALALGRSKGARAAGRDADLKRAGGAALARYRARPYLGPVSLAVATGTPTHPVGRRGGQVLVDSWRALLPDLTVVEVPGVHTGPDSMFAPEHLAATAAAIRPLLS